MVEPSNANLAVNNNIVFDATTLPYFADPATNDWSITYQSALLDAADNTIANTPAADITGLARPQGAKTDIGAYELPYYTVTVNFNAGGTVGSYSNGEVVPVAKGTPVAYTITPDANCEIKSVSYNSTDVTSSLVSGVFTAPALTANAILDVEFQASTGVNTNIADKTPKSVQYFDLTGKPVSAAAKGFVIKKITYNDGSVVNSKALK
jgi:hypothetical protein